MKMRGTVSTLNGYIILFHEIGVHLLKFQFIMHFTLNSLLVSLLLTMVAQSTSRTSNSSWTQHIHPPQVKLFTQELPDIFYFPFISLHFCWVLYFLALGLFRYIFGPCKWNLLLFKQHSNDE